MNKLHFLVGAALLLATNINAQSSLTGTAKPKDGYNQELIFSVLQKQATAKANKTTTASNERLLSTCKYSETSLSSALALEDSVVFTYSGDYHSQFNYNNMYYYWQNEFSGVPFVSGEPYLATNEIGVHYDNATAWAGNMWGSVDTNFTCNNLYNADDNIVQHTYQRYASLNETDNYFDASGNMILSYRWDNYMSASTFDTVNRINREFNTVYNNIIKDSQYIKTAGVWSMIYKNEYTYNVLQHLTQIKNYSQTAAGTWTVSSEYDIAYNAANQMGKARYYTLDTGNVLKLSTIDSFGWTSGVDYFTYHELRRYYYDGSIASKTTWRKHISPINNLPDSIYVDQVYPSASYHYLSVFNYNSNNNPVSEHYYTNYLATYDETVFINTYRYEPYFPAGIENTATHKAQMTAYPNPANNIVNISFSGLAAAPMHLKLINAIGQVVIEKEIDSQNTAQLSLSNIPTGVYRLIAEDKTTHSLFSQSIIKQ